MWDARPVTAGRLRYGKPLVGVRANGSRYYLCHREPSRELWFVSEDEDGQGGGPVVGKGGGSVWPFDAFVYGGRLPSGVKSVEVVTDTGTYRARCRPGLWIVAVLWGNRKMDLEFRFLGPAGEIVRSDWEQLSPVTRRSSGGAPGR
jgi:hypothetical protein